MKIGMVSEFYYPQPGGVSEHIRAVSQELALLGHEVVVLTSHIHGEVSEHGPRVRRLGRSLPIRYNGSLSRISIGWGLGSTLRRALDEEGCDLLHIHNPLMPTIPLLVLQHAKCPVVATFHSCYQRDLLVSLFRVPLRRLLRKVQVRVPVSLSAQRSVGHLFPGDYHIIPNGVDYEFFARASVLRLRRRKGGRRPGRRLLFVGATVWRKGLPTLIRAFAHVRARRNDVELHVVGGGPELARMRRITPPSLRDAVRFFGCVPRQRLVDFYADADLFCAPSLGRESFGMVLLEAMAAGLPVIASDIEGYRNVVSHGVEGILVEPGDATAWANAICALLDQPEEMGEYGRRGQWKAAGLRWREIARRLNETYGMVLRQPDRAAGVASRPEEGVEAIPMVGDRYEPHDG